MQIEHNGNKYELDAEKAIELGVLKAAKDTKVYLWGETSDEDAKGCFEYRFDLVNIQTENAIRNRLEAIYRINRWAAENGGRQFEARQKNWRLGYSHLSQNFLAIWVSDYNSRPDLLYFNTEEQALALLTATDEHGALIDALKVYEGVE